MAYNITTKAPKVRLAHYKGYRIVTGAQRHGAGKWAWWWEVRGLGKFKTLTAAKSAINHHLRLKKAGY